MVVHRDHPLALVASDGDVGLDVTIVIGAEDIARPGIESGDGFRGFDQLLHGDAQFFRQHGIALLGEVIQMLIDQARLKRGGLSLALELQKQAFPEVGGADPHGVEGLEQ